MTSVVYFIAKSAIKKAKCQQRWKHETMVDLEARTVEIGMLNKTLYRIFDMVLTARCTKVQSAV